MKKGRWCSTSPAGTTELLLVERLQVLRVVGASRDLYAGQAVDRLGVKLGYGFPAGAEVSRLAEGCAEEIDPRVSVQGTDCSLSGLQNQCEKLLAEGRGAAYTAKYCLTAIAKTVTGMLRAAHRQEPGPALRVCGRRDEQRPYPRLCHGPGAGVRFVPGAFSSDNAAGVAILAARSVEGRHG